MGCGRETARVVSQTSLQLHFEKHIYKNSIFDNEVIWGCRWAGRRRGGKVYVEEVSYYTVLDDEYTVSRCMLG